MIKAALISALVLCACSQGTEGAQAQADVSAEQGSATAAQTPPVQTPAAREAPQTPPAPTSAASAPQLAIYDTRVIRAYPHDVRAFTQGLFFADGALYESTGQRGQSVIRRIDLRDGTAAREAALPADVFGEGATVIGDKIVSLTWRAGVGYVHDLETLARLSEFKVEGEGWGIAYDESSGRLFLSDGTPTLRLLDPETFEETGVLDVTLNGRPLPRLNELEVVEGERGTEVWANIWQQDFIARIDADTGVVTGVIDVSALYPAARRNDPRDDVPNGIALEPSSGRLFLTGKRWPEIFEVELVERSP